MAFDIIRFEPSRMRVVRHILCTVAALATAPLVTPARADRCDDLALGLKGQIDGLSVGKTAANVIYLQHPAADQIRLGCASRSVSNELFAGSDSRKPKPAFVDLVASTVAIVFTIPKTDALTGTSRCLGRLGVLRGDDIRMRFRRLDFHCTRSKTGATITVARERDG